MNAQAHSTGKPVTIGLHIWSRVPLLLVLLVVQFLAGPPSASAHSASTAFLRIQRTNGSMTGQLELPLRDLDERLGLDADDDGRLIWGELRNREADIVRYVADRITLSAQRVTVPIHFGDLQVAHRLDEGYAVVMFRLAGSGAAEDLTVSYRILLDRDPLHRCLVSGPSAGMTGIITHENPDLKIAGTDVDPLPFLSLIAEGAHHIWGGYDHLLFLLALLLPSVLHRTGHGWTPAHRIRDIVAEVLKVVTAFTLAHSLTLSAAALGLIRIPPGIIETTIAASIILAAAANLTLGTAGQSTGPATFQKRLFRTALSPWTVAFSFGLIHGFGFAGALQGLGLSDRTAAIPLLGFNLGVELGQLACVAAFLPIAMMLRGTRFYRNWAVPYGSGLIILLAGGWTLERLLGLAFMPF